MPKADSDVNPPTGVRRLTVPASVDMVNVLGPRDEFLRILERDLAAEVAAWTTIGVAFVARMLTIRFDWRTRPLLDAD